MFSGKSGMSGQLRAEIEERTPKMIAKGERNAGVAGKTPTHCFGFKKCWLSLALMAILSLKHVFSRVEQIFPSHFP